MVVIVRAIEGLHGMGKSSLIEELHQQGFSVLTEDFLNLEPVNVNAVTSVTNEINVMLHWYRRVRKTIDKIVEDDPSLRSSDEVKILFVDRSPFACLAYMGAHERTPDFLNYSIISSRMTDLMFQMLYELVEYRPWLMLDVVYLEHAEGMKKLVETIFHRYKSEPSRQKYREHDPQLIMHVEGQMYQCIQKWNDFIALSPSTVLAQHMFRIRKLLYDFEDDELKSAVWSVLIAHTNYDTYQAMTRSSSVFMNYCDCLDEKQLPIER